MSTSITVTPATPDEGPLLAQLMHDSFTEPFYANIFPTENGTDVKYYTRAWTGFCSQFELGNPVPEGVPASMISQLGLRSVIATIRHEGKIVSGGLFWIIPAGKSVSQEPPAKRWGAALEGMSDEVVESFFNGMSIQHSATMGTEPHVFVEVMMTHPDHRGKGYASALLNHASSLADKDDIACYLDADPAAVQLYKKHLYEIPSVSLENSEMTPMRRPTKSQRSAAAAAAAQ